MSASRFIRRFLRMCRGRQDPAILRFEVTQECLNNCQFCNRPWKNKKSDFGHLTGWKANELLDVLLKNLRIDWVLLTGGDPLLWEGLRTTIDYLHDQGVGSRLKVGGKVLSQGDARALVKRGVDTFFVTLLSHKEAVHDRLRGRQGAHKNALATIRNIVSVGGRSIVRFVATRRNLVDLEGVMELANSFGIDEVHFYRFLPAGMGRKNVRSLEVSPLDLYYGLRVLDSAARDYHMRARVVGPVPGCLIDMAQFKHVQFGNCAVAADRWLPTVDPVGRLRICPVEGDIIADALTFNPSQDYLREARETFLQGTTSFCAGCAVVDSCRGGCRALAKLWYGSHDAEDPFVKKNKDIAVKR